MITKVSCSDLPPAPSTENERTRNKPDDWAWQGMGWLRPNIPRAIDGLKSCIDTCRTVRSRPHRFGSIGRQLSCDGYLDRNDASPRRFRLDLPDPDGQPALNLLCTESRNLLITFVTPVIRQTTEAGLTRFRWGDFLSHFCQYPEAL